MEKLFEKYSLREISGGHKGSEDLEEDQRKYLEDRKRFEEQIIRILTLKYRYVERVFQGEELESIVAYDKEDKIDLLINLDIDTIDELREAELDGGLREYIEGYA